MIANNVYRLLIVIISTVLVCDVVSGSDIFSLEEELIPTSYKQMVSELKFNSRLRPVARLDLSSFSPFCANFTKPSDDLSIEPECLRWEEQELDILLMYMELIAVGMEKNLAQQFYQEIRCLSRANIRAMSYLNAWEVCFTYDYSEVVGNLLASYVNQDKALKQVVRIPSTSRFFFGRVHDRNRGAYLKRLFASTPVYKSYISNIHRQTACCKSCAKSTHFVNVGRDQCLRNPFGKHCCHKACKSLNRLKIGVSSSVSFCCVRCGPDVCIRN